ncbi:hypothetical protein [Nannocystis sp. SCPEA4]|uniref:hypothetical protein n=1 Tax=Nannocystis sp. SCPEA4 TaxID=2996787 RepID=UPI002270C08E|nr:hypothetical protein [Nannocystis sp. SCPEA4]
MPVTSPQPREDLGRISIPVVGDASISLGLAAPVRLEIDSTGVELQFGSGLELQPTELFGAELQRLYVDFVDGVVETDSEALGPFFDRVLTVALCSVLRHTIGWEPGESALETGLTRLYGAGPKNAREIPLRSRFPAAGVTVDPDALLALELRGDALELSVARPLLIRVGGLRFGVVKARYVFATATVELTSEPGGPVRAALLRLAARTATRWLRRRLPAAMREPGYDLFADSERRANLQQLLARLRQSERPGPDEELEAVRRSLKAGPHAQAREATGGAASLFSGAKAAIAAGLATLKLSADDVPAATRVIARIPLGPFSSVALCTDRGGDVVLRRTEEVWQLEAPQGLYVYFDQFPELAELRLKQLRGRVDRHDGLLLDVRTSPPAGPFLEELLRHGSDRHVQPRVPLQWLRERSIVPPLVGHEAGVLWRQGLGDARELVVRTEAGSAVELRHTEEALVLTAPGGLGVLFGGLPYLPPARLQRLVYRWDDGALEIDGEPGLGAFGQAVLSAITRVRAAPHVPAGLGVRPGAAVELDEQQLATHSLELISLNLPLIGALQLRMDPQDTLTTSLGPAELAVRSERGLLLAAPELGLALELRGARHCLQRAAVEIDASAPPGDWLVALAGLCVEQFVIPALRRVVPLWPDADPQETWRLGHVFEGSIGELLGLTVEVTLPPGANLTFARIAGALVAGATAPVQVSPVGESLVGDFAIEALRWRPEGEHIEIAARPAAGPLLHAVVRRLHERFTPKLVLHALGRRLGLPQPWPPPPAPPELDGAPIAAPELPVLGPLRLHVDPTHPLALTLRRDGARFDFGQGFLLRLPELELQIDVRAADVTFLPFTVALTSLPQAGELDEQLFSHVVRGLFARALPWFWPTRRSSATGLDVLLAIGPVELCTPVEGALEVAVDSVGVSVRAPQGVSLGGEALAWLPEFTLFEFTYRFDDAAVGLRVGGLRESVYQEAEPISPRTEAMMSDLIRLFALPRTPAWAQRLGVRLLPLPPVPERDPGHITVLQAQLPGGHAVVFVHVAPGDVVQLSADRREIRIESERHLQIDVPDLRQRFEFHRARYHLETGDVEIDQFGRLENTIVAAVLKRALVAYEPAAAQPEFSAVATVLDRFPVDEDGRRVLYDSKLARVLLRPDTSLVVRLDEHGLLVTVDPPLVIDGASVFDYTFSGLRYSFDDASFHLDLERDGVLAGLLRGKIVAEGEQQLNSLLKPLLPAAMRKPGYRLALDPDPRATIAALIRTTVGGGFLLSP